MGSVIVVGNNKGGVGKTTVSIELSSALKMQKKKVLLVDLDPQCNSTSFSGAEISHMNVKDLMDAAADPEEVIQKLSVFDIISGSPALGNAETEYTGSERIYVLSDVLEDLKGQYDFIIIDLNTVYNNLLADMAYVAGDYLILPTNSDQGGIDAMDDVIAYVSKLKRTPIKPIAMVLVDYDKRKDASHQIWETMKIKQKELIPDGFIAKMNTDANAQSARIQRVPIREYNRRAKVLEDYTELAKSVIKYIAKNKGDKR